MPDKALAGYKVLSLSQYVAGPYCSSSLGGFGAEVIKVERPGTGDPARRVGPFFHDDPHPEKSLLFLHLNTNQKSITLNLKSLTGSKIFQELAKDSDILVENFAPRVMPSLGLSYEALAALNPRLVMTSISNFGQTGPYRDWKASDLVAQAMGGLAYVSGDPDREPLRMGGQQAQYQAGSNAFMASLTALWYRELTGEGQWVDISIMECLTAIMENLDARWEYLREVSAREGQRWVGRACWGPYPCRDGWVTMCLGGRRLAFLADLVGEAALANPDYRTGSGSMLYRDEIEALMMPFLMEHTKEELYHRGQAMGMPWGIVATPEDILSSPQLNARGYFVEVEHPMTGRLKYPGGPVIMHQTPWQTSRAPLLGEHNEEVYCGKLGYTRQDVVRLRELGVI